MRGPRVRTDHTHFRDQLRDNDGSSFDEGGGSISATDAAPESPVDGQVWVRTDPSDSVDNLQLFVWQDSLGVWKPVGAADTFATDTGFTPSIGVFDTDTGDTLGEVYVDPGGASGRVVLRSGAAHPVSLILRGTPGDGNAVGLYFMHGTGTPPGYVFLNLPTSDPLVAGALYSDGAPSGDVPKALMVSGGPS